MIKCIAIDDEPLALKQINSYIKKTPFLNLEASFLSAKKARTYLEQQSIDLIFIDINMPDLNGIDLVKSLKNPPKVIFTTAYREYAIEGFQLDAADYLLKPISYEEFLSSATKINERYFKATTTTKSEISKTEQFLFIKSEYKIVRIDFNDINYIEGMRDYVQIHLENQAPVMALMSIKKMVEYLPEERFMRVHRSYIVQLNKVNIIERNRIIFGENTYIPISDHYKNQFQHFLDNNFLK